MTTIDLSAIKGDRCVLCGCKDGPGVELVWVMSGDYVKCEDEDACEAEAVSRAAEHEALRAAHAEVVEERDRLKEENAAGTGEVLRLAEMAEDMMIARDAAVDSLEALRAAYQKLVDESSTYGVDTLVRGTDLEAIRALLGDEA